MFVLYQRGAALGVGMEAVIEEWKSLSAEELIAKKDAIEAEIMSNNAVLEKVNCINYGAGGACLTLHCVGLSLPPSLQQGGVGMHGRLVDSEGFPRADIDVFAVRTARHQIICKEPWHTPGPAC